MLFSIHPKQINHKPKVLLLGKSLGVEGKALAGLEFPSLGVQARLGALGPGREGKEMGLNIPAKPQQCGSVRAPPCKILCLCNCFVCLGWFCFGLVFSFALFAFTFSFCFASGGVFCSGSCVQHPEPGICWECWLRLPQPCGASLPGIHVLTLLWGSFLTFLCLNKTRAVPVVLPKTFPPAKEFFK